MNNRENIALKLESLPQKPGVYLMKDRGDQLIYVGKAKSLRNRVRSYFGKSADDGRIQFKALVSNITDFEYIITDNELEALILEANLIKEHKPRYNITLKDDKKYPFIKITNEDYPRILVVREMKKDKAEYFGPYTDVSAMRRTLEIIRRVFPVRTCQDSLPSPRITRVCLEYEIKRCGGPCEGFVSREEYQGMMEEVVLFLKGRNDRIIENLREKMKEASENLRFEEAASYRDRLSDIQSLADRQKVATATLDDWDIIAVCVDDDEACGVVMEVRAGKMLGRKHYFMDKVLDSSHSDIVSGFVRQFYLTSTSVPREIHLPLEIEEQDSISLWLSNIAGFKVTVKVPERGDKAKLIKMAERDAGLLLTERRLKREKLKDRVPNSVEALKRDLRLEVLPRRIEAIDISNVQGSDPVGSLVSFWDGRPQKGQYRRFKISRVEGPDDFAMIREVVQRRFKRLLEEGSELPDLLLIDGGKGQLSSAAATLMDVGMPEQPVIGLAKRLEEVFVPGVSEAQTLPKTSSSLRLLQAIRDEAHRFALEYHRKRRQKRTISSELDNIESIGESRKRMLLNRFGSVNRIAQADVEDIASIQGIGRKLASTIKDHLQKRV